MFKILKRAPPTTTTSSSLVCIKGKGRIEEGGMEGWLYSWRVGWNDCGWKMINQKLACPRPSARSPSLRPLARLGEVHRASFNATRSDILAPSLSSPLLPPDIVPLLFRSFLSVAAADIFCRSKGPFYLNSRIYCSYSLRALLIASSGDHP